MIHIIGMGAVGQALFNTIKNDYVDNTKCYDLSQRYQIFDENTIIDKDDPIFICIDTPTINGVQKVDNLTNILDYLITLNHKGLIIIKSTILFKNIEYYCEKLGIVMAPEFLNHLDPTEDFTNSDYLIFGGNLGRQALILHLKIFEFAFQPNALFCTIKEAIDFKYTRNLLQAYNVLFWEAIQDITNNSEKMAQLMEHLPVGLNSNISKNGYRGFGQSSTKDNITYSACLPKDLEAILSQNTQNTMLHYLNDYNRELL